MNNKQFLFLLCIIIFLNSCSKSKQCECNTPFVFGTIYYKGDVVSNRNACWMLDPNGGEGDPIIAASDEPRDTFPIAQDIWIKICEK